MHKMLIISIVNNRMKFDQHTPSMSSSALSPSTLLMNATKPQLRLRSFSSSVLGHIIFTLAKGPYLPKILQSCSSLSLNLKNTVHVLIPRKYNYYKNNPNICNLKRSGTFGFILLINKLVVVGSPVSCDPLPSY